MGGRARNHRPGALRLQLLAARLLGLARGWDRGLGPRALLACAPGDQHTIGPIAFGIALHELGWRITYLGADTPIAMTASAAEQIKPDLVVLAFSISGAVSGSNLRERISSRWPLALAGGGVTSERAQQAGGAHLDTDPITAAREVTIAQLSRPAIEKQVLTRPTARRPPAKRTPEMVGRRAPLSP